MEGEQVDYRTATFLVVDDDKVSIKTVQRAMDGLNLVNPVVGAWDGIEALEHLRGALDPETGRLPPYIVLLDLNMPRMNGLEFLRTIRDDPQLSRLVVFVVTTSDAPKNVAAAYDAHIAGYIVKEDLLDSLREGLQMIKVYSRLVLLP